MHSETWGYHQPDLLTRLSIDILRARVFRGLARKVVRKRLRGLDCLDVSRFGVNMRCHLHDNMTEEHLVVGGDADNSEAISALSPYIRSGDVFIDVGANCGLFSLVASRLVGDTGRIIAVEPNPTMLDRLRFNIQSNNISNMEVVEAAIAENVGFADLGICEKELGHSTMAEAVQGSVLSVRTLPIIDMLEDLKVSRIDVMKVDIEGYEDRAVMPLLLQPSLLPRAIVIEKLNAYYWREPCIVALIDAGYRIVWQNHADILLARALKNRQEGGGI